MLDNRLLNDRLLRDGLLHHGLLHHGLLHHGLWLLDVDGLRLLNKDGLRLLNVDGLAHWIARRLWLRLCGGNGPLLGLEHHLHGADLAVCDLDIDLAGSIPSSTTDDVVGARGFELVYGKSLTRSGADDAIDFELNIRNVG